MSIRAIRAALPLLVLTIRLAGAAEGQLDADPTLFAVFAALNASGYDAGLRTSVPQPIRDQVRSALTGRNIPSRDEVRRFLSQRRRANTSAEMSQYVSFALSVEPPPSFAWKVPRNEIPPDALALDGLGPLLARFYDEAGLEDIWSAAQPALADVISRHQGPVREAVQQVNAYLRNPSGAFLGRRFQIYVETLAEPNQTQSRQYGDDYFIVVSLAAEPQVEPIRHAYLHYLLDPLAAKYRDEWDRKRGLRDYALGSPILDESFKSDFLLLATESLIKAVEARLSPGSRRAGLIDQALAEGYVIAPYFGEALPLYEKQQQSMRLYYQDMVKAIDLAKEEQRLANIEFASTRTGRTLKPATTQAPVLSPGEKTLEQAEALYAENSLDPAKERYRRALELTDQKWLHARCYYGLARIAAKEKDPELAERLFRRTLESEPDAPTRSWTFVYLARLTQQHADGDADAVVRLLQAALAVEGGSEAARRAATEGLKLIPRGAPPAQPQPRIPQ